MIGIRKVNLSAIWNRNKLFITGFSKIIGFSVGIFSLSSAYAQTNKITIDQIGENFTITAFQIGDQNNLTGKITDNRLNQGDRGAAIYGAQIGDGNSINFNLSSTGSSLDTEAFLAFEQKGDNNSENISFSAENLKLSTLQIGDGTNITIAGNADSLLFKSSQLGSNHAAAIQLQSGIYDIDVEQSGTGRKAAQIELENPGGGIVTVDWNQTGANADTNTLIFSCGSSLGCELSYQD
tara:strand:- start:393 stop:1103 length:711 start_codon:yes stop_codon:yes gene_type:complete